MSVLPRASSLTPTSSRSFHTWGCRIRNSMATAVLLIALFALFKEHLAGAWRWIYVIAAVASLYLNVFVLVVQSFVKVSALTALAPTQTEPPFAITQAVVLAIFVLITLISVIKFRPPKTAFSTGSIDGRPSRE